MTLDELVELAREAEVGDPFDWMDLSIDDETAYRLVAMGVMEMEMSEEVMLATIVKLCVENMVLNYKILKSNT